MRSQKSESVLGILTQIIGTATSDQDRTPLSLRPDRNHMPMQQYPAISETCKAFAAACSHAVPSLWTVTVILRPRQFTIDGPDFLRARILRTKSAMLTVCIGLAIYECRRTSRQKTQIYWSDYGTLFTKRETWRLHRIYKMQIEPKHNLSQ